MVDWTHLEIQQSLVMLAGYGNTSVWQSNKTSTCYTYPSNTSPSPIVSPAVAPNVPSGYTLKSEWDGNFYNAVGGDYITYLGNTLVLEKNGSLLLLEGNSPTGTNVIWSFESGEKPGNATSGWDSSENRYLIKLNGNEIWAAPPRSCPAPTAKFMGALTYLEIHEGLVKLSGYDKGVTSVWQSNNTSTCYTYPSNTSPSPIVSPAPVTHSPSGSSPHTYTHCHTHSDPNHTHSQSDTINVVASKYTKSIRT
jgi:hypothetical protein